MLTEDFCSFEVAQLLKEKGFDELCDNYYGQSSDEPQQLTLDEMYYSYDVFIKAPTHQMAMKWLREVHQLHISIKPTWALGDMREPCRWEYSIISLSTAIDYMYYVGENTYEEAVEAACLYSLKNLI